MQLKFTKGSGKHDKMEVTRDGAPAESIECPKQGIIPHDMVHCAIEGTLRKRGFIGRILDGEAASFQMKGESESDGVERLVEVFQADGWSGWNSSLEDLLDLYKVACNARQCEPLTIQVDDMKAVRERMLELTSQWQSVPIGQSLTLQLEQGRNASEQSDPAGTASFRHSPSTGVSR